MIGKAEWFARRKYSGWGVTPSTWQGWVYILFLVAPAILVSNFSHNQDLINNFSTIWAIIILFDVVDIVAHMKKDERERIHEAYAERNAAWAMITTILVAFVYQVSGGAEMTSEFDAWLLIVLLVGLVFKAGTNLYLRDK